MFKTRSTKLERIDTGDYTDDEYNQFLIDIRLVNRLAGDKKALKNSLLTEIDRIKLKNYSVLDVGAGSGELLRTIAKFAKKSNHQTNLFGLELNRRSAESILEESIHFDEIFSVQGNALELPFAENTFDYVISSLFTHHLREEHIIQTLKEMKRVASRKVFIIDLHRHPFAYGLYKAFCLAFRISKLVKEDGSLSILRGFKPNELNDLANNASLQNVSVEKHFPYRLVLSGE